MFIHTLLILLSSVLSGLAEDCWWTGCQPSSWAVTGCAQYERDEHDKRNCDGGHEFKCCAKSSKLEASKSDICWWTGCQSSSWAVTGCAQYERLEKDRRSCDGGHEYHCCPAGVQHVSGSVRVSVQVNAPQKPGQSCWWTGCQPTSWAVTGCAQYDRQEAGRKSCDGGYEYNCCSGSNFVYDPPKEVSRPLSGGGSCWWTGCQPDSWAVTGCAQYDRQEAGRKSCDGGYEYNCCSGSNFVYDPPKEVSRPLSGGGSCWWTGCQPDSWAVTGCAQYDKQEVGRKSCDGGNEYHCCSGEVRNEPEAPKAPPQAPQAATPGRNCWWTGCQPNSWAVTGCAQYDREEVAKKHCDDGYEYHCCAGNARPAEAPKKPPPAPEVTEAAVKPTPKPSETDSGCWWTGCQLHSWEVRGCEHYHRVEKSRRPCEDGDQFQCCVKTSSDSDEKEKPKPPTVAEEEEHCWRSPCLVDDGSYVCPSQYILKKTSPCREGRVIMHCCPPSNKRPPTCKLPYAPQNGWYFSYTCTPGDERPQCRYNANTLVEAGFDLHYKCQDDFTLHGGDQQYCSEKGWEPSEQPVCSDECEPLASKDDELLVVCYRWDNVVIPCNQKMKRGSYAIFRCPPTVFYLSRNPGYDRIVCHGGSWSSRLPEGICKPTCGLAQLGHGELHVVNGVAAKLGAFPWHAGIYHYMEGSGSYDQFCGGTLVSSNVVITAAHCFKNESERFLVDISPKENIRIALGQLQREFNSPKDLYRQIFKVKEVKVNPEYTGGKDNYGDDIAVVILDKPVVYTAAVLLACLDIGTTNTEEDQLKPGAIGQVAGWGLNENLEISNELKMASMPFVVRDQCLQDSLNLYNYITKDKMCAIDRSSPSVTVCGGDSGGGYVFQDRKSKQFYLRGIVSAGAQGCDGDDYALFTRVSKHAQWLSQYVKH